MSWWNAKYKNDHGEYEITFASKDYEKTKVVEKVCQAIIDKRINTDNAADFVERIIKYPASLRPKGECKFCSKEDNGALCWDCSDLGISIEYRAGRIRVTNEYGDEAYLGVNFCPNCGADMRGNPNDS